METNKPLSEYNEADLAKWYIDLRDWLQAREKDHEDFVTPTKTLMKDIETEFQQRLNAAGATSFRTISGTVVRSSRTTYSVEDRAAFGKYILDSGCWEATSLRPTKEVMEDYLRESKGELPPGVVSNTSYTISVKKPKPTTK